MRCEYGIDRSYWIHRCGAFYTLLFWTNNVETVFSNIIFTTADGTQFTSIRSTSASGYTLIDVYYDNVLVFTGGNWVNVKYRLLKFTKGDNSDLVSRILGGVGTSSIIAPQGAMRLGDVLKFDNASAGNVFVNGVVGSNG